MRSVHIMSLEMARSRDPNLMPLIVTRLLGFLGILSFAYIDSKSARIAQLRRTKAAQNANSKLSQILGESDSILVQELRPNTDSAKAAKLLGGTLCLPPKIRD